MESNTQQRRIQPRHQPLRRLQTSSDMMQRMQDALRGDMMREFLAEFISTYVMMVFGLGSVAQTVLGENNYGTYLSINLGFGFGVVMGVHVAGGISGAHMNSALTFTSCVLGQMPWKKFPVYTVAQCCGSFLASATIYGLFYQALLRYTDGNLTVTGPRATAGIFATYPASYMTLWRGFIDEIFLTGILQVCLLAINDKKNCPALQGTHPLVIGVLVITIGLSLGMNTGYAINPSRDLPPRIFTSIAGWGNEVFTAAESWWWVPVVAPPLGSLMGAIIYLLLIGQSHRHQGDRNSEVAATPKPPRVLQPLQSLQPMQPQQSPKQKVIVPSSHHSPMPPLSSHSNMDDPPSPRVGRPLPASSLTVLHKNISHKVQEEDETFM
ncbi:aquaporin-7-like isoform X2 [Antechinus flavipes]|uniref:aquaporin-7-like isoform X2 n=1 Tax=Antechinus flavipes TaxID=38775 RepID=UPI0022363630|nr:aquaporin-7-like isoform X2 [Antechinus flavipes]